MPLQYRQNLLEMPAWRGKEGSGAFKPPRASVPLLNRAVTFPSVTSVESALFLDKFAEIGWNMFMMEKLLRLNEHDRWELEGIDFAIKERVF